MSRIGKLAITLPEGVRLERQGRQIICTGPKGSLGFELMDEIKLTAKDQEVKLEPIRHTRQAKAYWGLARSLLANIALGVSQGWQKELEIRGVGFRAAVQGKSLKLNLGHSHEIDYPIPEGVEISCERPTSIMISGIDKQKIGQIAAEIRAMRPPEPYKGKGVRYVGEYVLQKEGKKK